MREILKDIVDDDNRAGEVIRRMRALVKKEEIEFAALDLGNIISDVVLLTHSDAILHNIRVVLEVNSGLPPVRGDKVQLQQVLLNLLLNAFDALKNSPAEDRSVAVQAELDGADMLKVGVRDGGMGLHGDQLDKIFQPFYTTKRDGFGMGLSISRSIVEATAGGCGRKTTRTEARHLILRCRRRLSVIVRQQARNEKHSVKSFKPAGSGLPWYAGLR